MSKKDRKAECQSLMCCHTSCVLSFLKRNYIGCYLRIQKILKYRRKFTFQAHSVFKYVCLVSSLVSGIRTRPTSLW